MTRDRDTLTNVAGWEAHSVAAVQRSHRRHKEPRRTIGEVPLHESDLCEVAVCHGVYVVANGDSPSLCRRYELLQDVAVPAPPPCRCVDPVPARGTDAGK
eukprot:SAG11_NODE_1667_length_4494_cov_5.922412_2_plen_100_part_00